MPERVAQVQTHKNTRTGAQWHSGTKRHTVAHVGRRTEAQARRRTEANTRTRTDTHGRTGTGTGTEEQRHRHAQSTRTKPLSGSLRRKRARTAATKASTARWLGRLRADRRRRCLTRAWPEMPLRVCARAWRKHSGTDTQRSCAAPHACPMEVVEPTRGSRWQAASDRGRASSVSVAGIWVWGLGFVG